MVMGKNDKEVRRVGKVVSLGKIDHVDVACNEGRKSVRRSTGDGSVGVHWW